MEKKEVMVMNLKPTVDEMEGARRATGISSAAALRGYGAKTVVPNPEVPEKAHRRSYTAEYKRLILKEAEGCKEQGQVGALLRREGLYSSNLTAWRRQVERGTLDALSSKKRGPKARSFCPAHHRTGKRDSEVAGQAEESRAYHRCSKKIAAIFQLPGDQKDGEGL